MNDARFRELIYGPYMDAWKIIKRIQHADQTKECDKVWQEFVDSTDELLKAYPKCEYTESIVRVVLDAGTYIAKINKGEEA